MPANVIVPDVSSHQARDRAQRRALAGAVGAQQADGFAFADLDGDIGIAGTEP